jgi:mono/diheme cytochrome c family protein
MPKWKIALGVVGGIVGLLLVSIVGFAAWAHTTALGKLAHHWDTHTVDFPIPPPLSDSEVAVLRAEKLAAIPVDPAAPPVDPAAPVAPPPDPLADVDLGALALERSIARGKHLVEARFACMECHGADFGGGVMVDDPMIGTLKGRNLTLGKGSVTADFKASDWDRAVRHGVKHDGSTSVMPAQDFFAMSDQELADVVDYIRSFPPVDADVPPPVLGPLGKVLCATGKIYLAAEHVDHQKAHDPFPPDSADALAFGKHLASTCQGCHRPDFNGGPINGGPPDWPPSGNLTREDGLQSWTLEQFTTLLRTGVRPDGSKVRPPMADMPKLAANMTDPEIAALFTFLQTLDPKPTGE